MCYKIIRTLRGRTMVLTQYTQLEDIFIIHRIIISNIHFLGTSAQDFFCLLSHLTFTTSLIGIIPILQMTGIQRSYVICPKSQLLCDETEFPVCLILMSMFSTLAV